MAFIDGTVVNVALPELQRQLNASLVDVQWVIEAYALFLAALLLVGGAAGDRFGRRRVFLLGVALFAFSSLGCGLARSVRELVLARALQGIGGALLVPGSLAIISASFADHDRGKAIGTWSGAAVAPVLIEAVDQQRNKLGAIELPAGADAGDTASARHAIAEAFVTGFRAIMLISAALALASAVSAWLLIEGASPLSPRGRNPVN